MTLAAPLCRTALAAVALLSFLAGCDAKLGDAKAREKGAQMRVHEEPIQAIAAPPERDEDIVSLGKELFHDQRFSSDGKIACASCHIVHEGGDDGIKQSKGVGGVVGAVNAPTVLNAANNFAFFWDGRAATLEDQIDGPLANPSEMAFSWESALKVIRDDPKYARAFDRLFEGGVTKENVKKAIATYERALITPSRFDRFLKGDADAITEAERKGYELFKSMGCVACHQGRNVGGNMFQRFGVMGDYFKDRGNITDADYGRYNVTKNEADRYTFRVPSLRNVALTAPYFHDGSAAALPDAIRVMARYQLGREIADAEVASIAAFLGSLTGEVRTGLTAEGKAN